MDRTVHQLNSHRLASFEALDRTVRSHVPVRTKSGLSQTTVLGKRLQTTEGIKVGETSLNKLLKGSSDIGVFNGKIDLTTAKGSLQDLLLHNGRGLGLGRVDRAGQGVAGKTELKPDLSPADLVLLFVSRR